MSRVLAAAFASVALAVVTTFGGSAALAASTAPAHTVAKTYCCTSYSHLRHIAHVNHEAHLAYQAPVSSGYFYATPWHDLHSWHVNHLAHMARLGY